MTGPNDRHRPAKGGLRTPGPKANVSDALSRAISASVFAETTRRLASKEQRLQKQDGAIRHFAASLLSAERFDPGSALATLEATDPDGIDIVYAFERCATALGSYWEDDDNNFFDVAVASSRLQIAARHYCESIEVEPSREDAYEALVATVPGEQHTFAATLLELILRLKGWNTTVLFPDNHADLDERIRLGNYDVVCLSWTTTALTEVLFTLNKTLEAIPEQVRPIVLAGGLAAGKREKWLVRAGVDHVANNARAAVDIGKRAVEAKRLDTEHQNTQTEIIGDNLRSAN